MISTRWPLATSEVRPQTEGKVAFASLKGGVYSKKKPKSARAAWISKETYQLANWRVELQKGGRAITREVRKARHYF